MRQITTLCLLWISMTGAVATAQDTNQQLVVCDIGVCKEITLPKPRYSNANAFSVDQIWTVVNDILQVSGLLPNFQVVDTDEVSNAAAIIIDGERYLAFNPDWLVRYKSDPQEHWLLYGVMAHEVGHHLQGHTITGTGSRPPTELEADEYAGFTLAALGANLTEAQSLWATLSESGSVSHPPRHQRLAAVERGWLRRASLTKGTVDTSAKAAGTADKPLPTWARRNCTPVLAVSQQADLCFSSYLSPQGSSTYTPKNTRDGNSNTAWVEGVPGQGIGENFTLIFNERAQVNQFSIRNGYAKSTKAYTRNSRVRKLKATASNGQKITLMFSDTSEWQTIDTLTDFGPVSWITFEISNVYPGTHYQDTAITELAFD
jgi:hypothetical protein